MKHFTDKLLPCAHCGSHDVRFVRTITDEHTPAWYIECLDCGIRTSNYTDDCISGSSYDEVIEATNKAIECCVNVWNTRANRSTDNADNLRRNPDDDKRKACNTCDDDRCPEDTPDYLGMREVMDDFDRLFYALRGKRNRNGK